MSWTESLFQKAERWLIHMDQQRKGLLPSEHSARLEEIKSILSIWVSLISGRSWTIQESESWPAFDSERLFFPPVLDIFDDPKLNRRAYLFIACYLLGMDEDKLPELRNWRQQFQTAHLSLGPKENPKAISLLHQRENVKAQTDLSSWTSESFHSVLNLWTVRKLQTVVNRRDQNGENEKPGPSSQQARKKKAREQIQVVDQMKDPEADNPLVHSFEKLHTTDDYNGGQKNQDGEDELGDHEDSLDELEMKQVIRSQERTKATLKGDFVMDLEVAESLAIESQSHSRIFHYDEWDERKSSYHSKWCRLEERTPILSEETENSFSVDKIRKAKRSQIELLARCFFSLFQSPKWKTRQLEGTELDLDALVDFMSTPAEKRPDKMNVYMNRRKDLNELSVVLLFDRSFYYDSWINDRRVLDITRESMVVIGEALKRFPLPVQLASFSSQTRNKVYYDLVKDFDENWNLGLKRLGTIEPSGYTRIGPALRHATSQLQGRKCKHKWIILVSDAKPTDYDKYEGNYGVRDVRKAIQEAKMQNIGVRCLSVDKENRFELAEMFGTRGYELLPKVDDLPNRLGFLLKNLVQMAR